MMKVDEPWRVRVARYQMEHETDPAVRARAAATVNEYERMRKQQREVNDGKLATGPRKARVGS